jgi:hypothetical protein
MKPATLPRYRACVCAHGLHGAVVFGRPSCLGVTLEDRPVPPNVAAGPELAECGGVLSRWELLEFDLRIAFFALPRLAAVSCEADLRLEQGER